MKVLKLKSKCKGKAICPRCGKTGINTDHTVKGGKIVYDDRGGWYKTADQRNHTCPRCGCKFVTLNFWFSRFARNDDPKKTRVIDITNDKMTIDQCSDIISRFFQGRPATEEEKAIARQEIVLEAVRTVFEEVTLDE